MRTAGPFRPRPRTWAAALLALTFVLAMGALSTAAPAGDKPLSVKILEPKDGSTVSGIVTVVARVSGTPLRVEFNVNGWTYIDMVEISPNKWSAQWDSTAFPDRTYPLSVNAYDERGLVTGSAGITVTVENETVTVGEWTHARGDLQARAQTDESLGKRFEQLWSVDDEVGHAQLVLYDDVLYAASTTWPGSLSALNARTGRLLFSRLMENNISPAAAGPEGVYVSVLNRAVVAVTPDGSTLWRSAVPGSSPPLVTPHGILVGDQNGVVHALDPKTGASLWSVQTQETAGFRHRIVPVYAEGRLYLPGWGGVPVIDVENRQVVTVIDASPWRGLMYDNGLLYVARDYALMAFDGASGEYRWSFRTPSHIGTPPAASQGMVIFGSDEPTLYALDGATGEVRWSRSLDSNGSAYGSPVIAGDRIYTGTSPGGLKVFDLHTGRHVTTLLPNVPVRETAVPAGGMLYVPDAHGGVYALKSR